MKSSIHALLTKALENLVSKGVLESVPAEETIQVERTRDPSHGDFASNCAMMLCKSAGMKPRDLAQQIIDSLPGSHLIQEVSIAGPGFINFRFSSSAWHTEIRRVLEEGVSYGTSHLGKGEQVLVEFVSANPTGPLHVGHGRHAAYGASLANLLEAVGYNVRREYYVNDAGRQMQIGRASCRERV